MTPARRPTSTGFTRGPRVADRMTPQMFADHQAACLAEREGDAFAARELHARIPMFRRSGHQVVLRHLDALSEEMTPWLWARWAAYQCTRVEGGHGTGLINREAIWHVLPALYADRLVGAYATGGDHLPVIARVLAESWALHQVATYDLGGLSRFLDEHATGRLACSADTARAWALAPMGGYRVEASPPGSLHVTDVLTGTRHELLDLGAATHAVADGFVIGRLVSSGTTPSFMFDTRPLAVDAATARAVAARVTPLGWLDALATAVREGRVDRALIDSEDRELATDVAGLALLDRGTPPPQRAAVRESLSRGRDEIGRAAYRILCSVARDELGPESDAAYVAAAVVNPHGHTEAWRLLATSTPQDRWARWARLVPEPARGRLLRLAASAAVAS